MQLGLIVVVEDRAVVVVSVVEVVMTVVVEELVAEHGQSPTHAPLN